MGETDLWGMPLCCIFNPSFSQPCIPVYSLSANKPERRERRRRKRKGTYMRRELDSLEHLGNATQLVARAREVRVSRV